MMSRASIKRRRSTPETHAGQYMCPECGQVFETKKEVDNHIQTMHEPHIRMIYGGLSSGSD